MTAERSEPVPSSRSLRAGLVGVAVLALMFVVGIAWAKWIPYAQRAGGLDRTHHWSGSAIFATAGTTPSLSGAWHFARAYFASVWHAALVALLIAAALDALVPKAWLLTVLNRRTTMRQALAGGTAALPSLMCTCCTAPVTVGLRRRGAATAASLAYWVGNPVLNPAVLAFLFLVAPWQLGVVRILVGVPLVFGATALIARVVARPDEPRPAAAADPVDAPRLRDLPARYLRSLLRFALILVPEYVVVVLLTGLVSGWLSDFSGLDGRLGLLAVPVCALIGTLLVVPTGGEIPVVLALAAAGLGAGVAGALLITLPALSLPSMVMVGRALSWRVTAAMAAAVAVAGLAAAVVLSALL